MATQQRTNGGNEQSLERLTRGLPSSPHSLLRRLSDDMERLLDGFGIRESRWPLLWGGEPGKAWTPDIDVYERKGQLVIHADLPGLTKKDVKVEVADGELMIEGERKMEKEGKGDGTYRAECAYGAFRRTLSLPEGAKADQAKASFKNGVLEVTMPVPPRKKNNGRRLKIEAS